MKPIIATLSLFLCLSAFSQGKLLIVGGGLDRANKQIYDAFIKNIPSGKKALIIPAASGKPSKNSHAFKKDLIDYGFPANRIAIAPIAVLDDSTTKSINESTWSKNGFSQSLLTQKLGNLDDYGGVWFIGGDQMRILQTMISEKQISPIVRLCQKIIAKNGVVGGTSAGAAIMSEIMIAAGDSYSALLQDPAASYTGMESQELGPLFLTKGLGLFPYGIIDQHFDRKGRLGRLVRTLDLSRKSFQLGFGIDEDTAMLVDLDKQEFRVVGTATVVVISTSKSKRLTHSAFAIKGIELSILRRGDLYSFKKMRAFFKSRNKTRGREYFNFLYPSGAGLSLANPRLDHLLGFGLLDNRRTKEVSRFQIVPGKLGFEFRFYEGVSSEGYWQTSGSREFYSIDRVLFDIIPTKISLKSQI